MIVKDLGEFAMLFTPKKLALLVSGLCLFGPVTLAQAA